MKCHKYLFFLLFLPMLVNAQGLQRTARTDKLQPQLVNRSITGFEQVPVQRAPVSVPRKRSVLNQEVNLGSTFYDLQSNASMSNRVWITPEGVKTAGWMLSLSTDNSYPDRGTGINQYEGVWQSAPDARVESVRTGWPSVSALGDGTVLLSTHTVENTIHLAKQAPGAEEWMESTLPTNVPDGLLWPRSVTGGSDGMSVHLVALTVPAGDFGGSIYQGVDGHLLYFRSQDGGETWDQTDVIIPGLDNSAYAFLSADTYGIAAHGETVAIVVFGVWGDVSLFKSTDNGTSWNRTIIQDFPLDAYQIDDGYTLEDIPDDPFRPDTLAIYTSSGDGSVVIDAEGTVHVAFAENYVQDDATGDGVSSYYPGWSGIVYWNEAQTELQLIGDLIDYDGNDTIDILASNVSRYGNGTATGNPALATGPDGTVCVVYTAVSEAHFNELDEQNYRHLVAVKSTDGGNTWGPLYDLINDEFTDPEFNDFIEAVYPSTFMMLNDTFHIVYQQDFFPGPRDEDEMDPDPRAENFLVYLPIPVESIPADGVTSSHDLLQDGQVAVWPTITEGVINVEVTRNLGEIESCRVWDLTGRCLQTWIQSGSHCQLDLGAIPAGLYLLQVETVSGVAVKQIFKQ